MVPEHLYDKMLGFTVLAHESRHPEIKWTLGVDPCGDNEPQLRWSFTFTTPAFGFRAVLSGIGSEEVQVTRT